MSDQLPMFEPTISEVTANAISSLESESGATPYDSPAGPTSVQSGQARARAPRSARPGKDRDLQTLVISGHTGPGSSASQRLTSSLANNLRTQLATAGSTLYRLTWNEKVTPLGRSYSRLAASEPRTRDKDFTGWPTPDAQAMNVGCDVEKHQARMDKLQEKHANGNGAGPMLGFAAALTGWPTVRAEDAESSGMRHSRGVADTMTAVATLCGWQTPHGPREHDSNVSESTYLGKEAQMGAWPTPMAGSPATEEYNEAGNNDSSRKTVEMCRWPVDPSMVSGETPIGYLLGPNGWGIVPASGQLNAEHSRWLMGLPRVWDDCGVTAMASSRKRRKPS